MVLSKETRALLKVAFAAEAGRIIGKGIRGTISGGANFGGGLADALGAPTVLGQLAGGGAVLGAGALAARKAKQKIDEARYGYAGANGNYGVY